MKKCRISLDLAQVTDDQHERTATNSELGACACGACGIGGEPRDINPIRDRDDSAPRVDRPNLRGNPVGLALVAPDHHLRPGPEAPRELARLRWKAEMTNTFRAGHQAGQCRGTIAGGRHGVNQLDAPSHRQAGQMNTAAEQPGSSGPVVARHDLAWNRVVACPVGHRSLGGQGEYRPETCAIDTREQVHQRPVAPADSR